MTVQQSASAFKDTLLAPQVSVVDTDSQLPFQNGHVIQGRYRVNGLLGSGGMGLVFEGEHLELGNRVAIKVIRPRYSSDPHIVARFVNEARSVAALDSPHIARVFDAGQLESGEAFMVMEHLKGTNLLTHLQQVGALPYAQAAHFLIEASEGLAQAHAMGLIHRDLKPEHLFIVDVPGTRRTIKLLDFGIAKRLTGSSRCQVTNPGDSIGSPCYMSPEQMQNPRDVDVRTDIWSLGVVAYEALTARKPFDGDTIGQLQWNVLAEEPTPLPQIRPGIPDELVSIVMRCLEKKREQRFRSMEDLAGALRTFLLHQEPGTEPTESSRPRPMTLNQPKNARFQDAASQAPGEPSSAAAAAARMPAPPVDTGHTRTSVSLVEELEPAGVPRRRLALSWTIFAAVSVAVFGILGLWAVGGVGGLQALTHGLTADPNTELDAQNWVAPSHIMVKLDALAGSPATKASSSSPKLTTNDRETVAQEELRDPKKAARTTATVDSNEAGEALTPEQKRERYQQWLDRQNLAPVENVVLSDSDK